MMLKLQKSYKWKLFSIITCGVLLSLGYFSLSFYSIPEKANAVTWYPEKVPADATIKDIKYMQEMNKTVCDNSENITDEVTLEDARDGNKYTVKRVSGRCWMTSNLRLDLSIAKIANVADSDNLSTDYPAVALPNRWSTPTDNAWESISTLDEFSKLPAKISPTNGSALQENSGYFYSWCAATAKTCDSVAAAGDQASGSICPKGWRLLNGTPGTGTNDFAVAAGITTNITASADTWSRLSNPSISNNALTVNGITWIAAGSVNTLGLINGGVTGYYWSRTASSATNTYALNFSVNSPSFVPAYANGNRSSGSPVRCVANETITTSNKVTNPRTASGSITVKVANTISIDAVDSTDDIEVDSTKVANGTFSATVMANTAYKVLLSAEQTSLKSKDSTNTAEIPSLPNVVAGTNAWGIKKENGDYEAMVDTNNAKEYYNTNPENTTTTPGIIHQYTVGISVSPSLPADTYTTDVTITAVAV